MVRIPPGFARFQGREAFSGFGLPVDPNRLRALKAAVVAALLVVFLPLLVLLLVAGLVFAVVYFVVALVGQVIQWFGDLLSGDGRENVRVVPPRD